MKGYRKVLIAVNGSMAVLKEGLKLASDEKCWVTVVKVIPPHEGALNLTGVKNLGDLLNSGGEQILSEIKETAKAAGALVKTRLEQGEIHEKIVETADEEDCDLIILGTNKTNWFRKLFGKNVVENVINLAPCPVLVVGA